MVYRYRRAVHTLAHRQRDHREANAQLAFIVFSATFLNNPTTFRAFNFSLFNIE